jgi:hypothetical protein
MGHQHSIYVATFAYQPGKVKIGQSSKVAERLQGLAEEWGEQGDGYVFSVDAGLTDHFVHLHLIYSAHRLYRMDAKRGSGAREFYPLLPQENFQDVVELVASVINLWRPETDLTEVMLNSYIRDVCEQETRQQANKRLFGYCLRVLWVIGGTTNFGYYWNMWRQLVEQAIELGHLQRHGYRHADETLANAMSLYSHHGAEDRTRPESWEWALRTGLLAQDHIR